jgi:hypothetical protein
MSPSALDHRQSTPFRVTIDVTWVRHQLLRFEEKQRAVRDTYWQSVQITWLASHPFPSRAPFAGGISSPPLASPVPWAVFALLVVRELFALAVEARSLGASQMAGATETTSARSWSSIAPANNSNAGNSGTWTVEGDASPDRAESGPRSVPSTSAQAQMGKSGGGRGTPTGRTNG